MYDLIIIGAGSTGSVVAARASEDPNRSVLLIEAGPDYPEISRTPFDLVNSHNNSYTDHDWGLVYEPVRGREVAFPRGRVVGGSSAVNTTIALRGVPEDYDEWAEQGNTQWTWQRVLPAFKRLERDLDYGHLDHHGDAGPITIRRYPYAELLPQHQAFLASAERLGYPDCPDQNDPSDFGVGPQPMNKLGRLRVSVAVGYLAAARIRPNLTIQAETTVRRLIISEGRCTGVEVQDGDATRIINGRTVVLSAGAIGTPCLLMHSGIGPAEHLADLGIPVLANVPGVGQNLADHPALSIAARVKDRTIIDLDQPIIQTILRYTAPDSTKRNDLQIEQFSFSATRANAPDTFGIAAVLEYQYGRGEIRLRSRHPDAPPIIDSRFCEDERDTARLVAAFKDTLAFTRSGPLADMIDEMIFPDASRPLDDEAIATLCRRRSGSGYHPSGTAKMGPATDPLAVVDQYGCSHAIDQLVIADASIMPQVPRANTNLTCIMIGEMIGEWLRTQPGHYGL